ncbi:mitochondrial GTPase 2 [Scheffersomyces coipomensis]|uniref:mitochondrial GTPase 2 n=1 Tax=Scheffersomyces coipomensis TaxID=1788519 RepID=UPI00315D1C55
MYPTSNHEILTDISTEGLPEEYIKNPRNKDSFIKYYDNGIDNWGYNSRILSLADYFEGNSHHVHHVFYNNQQQSLMTRGKRVENRTFIDLKLIRCTTGKGGNGAITFFRDANRPLGPPDGGDGGDGGSIYFTVVDKNMSSLHRLKRTYEAGNGVNGKGSQLDGKRGDDIIIEIPVGTTIKWIPDPLTLRKYLSRREGEKLDDIKLKIQCDQFNNIQLIRETNWTVGEGWSFTEGDREFYETRDYFNELNEKVKENDHEIIQEELKFDTFPILGLDLSKPTSKPELLLKGGKGGMGNMHFLTKDIRNPNFSKKGREGITSFFLLELKLIADLGLVGLPNAGKSTLLRSISKARPRVGHWEFTTLQPTVGTIFTTIDEDPFTVADIPGIIKGASENKGMGLDFLRHIERCAGLVFVISLESKNPIIDLEVLLNEVGEKRMKDKKILIVATKADLNEDGENYMNLKQYIEPKGWKIVPVCAMKGQNVETCIKLMSEVAYSGKK